jgi:hypothetical protein
MALTEPLDLLSTFPGWCTSFDLMARQEQSRHASGRTRTKDFGSPIWRAKFVSKTLSPNALDRWRALLELAQVDQIAFTAWPLSRTRPAKHPGSAVLPTGTLFEIGANNKSARFAGLTGITLSVGDFVQLGANLYRMAEPATAVSGTTPLAELRPHFWPGTVTGQVVKIYRPACLMVIDPGSVQSEADPRTGRGSISFSAIESRG